MGKFEGMDPKLVRKLLTEVRRAAEQMRTSESRVASLVSAAGVPAQATHRPVQVADAADEMVRDVSARLTLLEKREREKPTADDPGRNGQTPRDAGDAAQQTKDPEGKDSKGDRADNPRTGETSRDDPPKTETPAPKEPEPRETPAPKDEQPRETPAPKDEQPRETPAPKDEQPRETPAPKDETPVPKDEDKDSRGDRGENPRDDRECAPESNDQDRPDTPRKDHPDDTDTSQVGVPKVVEVDGVKIVTVPLDPPSMQELESLLENMQNAQPVDNGVVIVDDGQVGRPTPDGPPGQVDPGPRPEGNPVYPPPDQSGPAMDQVERHPDTAVPERPTPETGAPGAPEAGAPGGAEGGTDPDCPDDGAGSGNDAEPRPAPYPEPDAVPPRETPPDGNTGLDGAEIRPAPEPDAAPVPDPERERGPEGAETSPDREPEGVPRPEGGEVPPERGPEGAETPSEREPEAAPGPEGAENGPVPGPDVVPPTAPAPDGSVGQGGGESLPVPAPEPEAGTSREPAPDGNPGPESLPAPGLEPDAGPAPERAETLPAPENREIAETSPAQDPECAEPAGQNGREQPLPAQTEYARISPAVDGGDVGRWVADGDDVVTVEARPPSMDALGTVMEHAREIEPMEMPGVTVADSGEWGEGEWASRQIEPDGPPGHVDPGPPERPIPPPGS
jgi:hypothetical protein